VATVIGSVLPTQCIYKVWQLITGTESIASI
jgi:hypothetical protein